MLPEMFKFHENEIDYANKFIEDLINAVPVSLNFWSTKTQVSVLANNAVMDVFKVKTPEEFNELFLELSPEYQPDGVLTAEKAQMNVQKAFAEGFAHFEWMHQTKDKELIPAEVALVKIDHKDDIFVAGFVRDLRELNKTIKLLKNMENLAFTDELTGIYNRRYFMTCAQDLLIDAKKCQNKFFIIMFDGDKFKSVNDTYGHQAGDYVLKTTADIVKHTLRANDIIGRYGGEEFIIALTCLETKNAKDIAERIRGLIEAHEFAFNGKVIPFTISLGIAEAHPYSLQIEDVISNADKALYHAKSVGRNRVELFTDIEGLLE